MSQGGTAPGAAGIPRILFLCTGNSCRSQMAEGWARHLKRGVLEAWSAGVESRGLDPRAVEVMAEVGIDISGQRSKRLEEVSELVPHIVVTVCDDARESCPVFPRRARLLHRSFDDPPRLASTAATRQEVLGHYRRVRDEIGRFIETLPAGLS